MSSSVHRFGGRFGLMLAGVVIIIGLQLWHVVRDTARVRVVLYNEGPGIMDDVSLTCANQTEALGTLMFETSRYVWFRPEERSVVVIASWVAADGNHETGWATERGERLTVRVNADGAPTVSRERSLGRRLLDELALE